jgi:uncharacterized membrane protein YdfJ with MMPL/SSD domain
MVCSLSLAPDEFEPFVGWALASSVAFGRLVAATMLAPPIKNLGERVPTRNFLSICPWTCPLP